MESGGGNGGSSDSAKPIPAETATNSLPGCGCASASNITVRVTPTTGGQFDLQVAKTESVENLKKIISKKLKVPKERICLLHRDRQLRDGTLQENQLMDGSRLTLLPSVETGLLAQRPEQSVMQALESLNDSQVNDFLSGKAPLNLTMRLGDHMMLIQLQLSTVTPSSSRRSSPSLVTSSSRNSLATSLSSVVAGSTSATTTTSKTSSPSSPKQSPPKSSTSVSGNPSSLPLSSSSSSSTSTVTTSTAPQQQKPPPLPPLSSETKTSSSTSSTSSNTSSTSRFKISSPLSAIHPKPMETSSNSDSKDASTSTDPIPVHPSRTTVPISQSPLKSLEDAANLLTRTGSTNSNSSSSTSTTTTTTSSNSSSNHASASASHSCSGPAVLTSGSSTACKCEPPAKPTLDTRALAEASRNLTQTLKQLSSEVLTSRSDPAEDSARSRRQGAIIESMHHHGKGVYSGTFSGTLNPALQDRFGRPKRDISTIIHILNDLLCATPQYRRHARQGHTITVEASSSNTQKQTSSTTTTEKTPANVELMDESGSLSRENQATRGKMEHLRLIMEERRARRRARREARAAPYTTQWSAKSESVSQPAGMGHDAVEPMDTSEQSTGSEQQLCELNPPEPVVA